MTDTVFLVVHSGGEYDDKWSNNLHAFTTNEKAEGYVALMKARDEYAANLRLLVSAYFVEWQVNAEEPANPKTLPMPKLPSNMPKKVDRTPAYNLMVEEINAKRSEIGMRNKEIYDAYAKEHCAWMDKWVIARHDFVTAHVANNPIVHLELNQIELELLAGFSNFYSYSSSSETDYSIEEVNLD